MKNTDVHSFHIPVMGIGYTIDSPVKVARFGITSVVSIIEDHIIEKLRAHYSSSVKEQYVEITTHEEDYRAKRITSYLNMLDKIVDMQFEVLKSQMFVPGSEIEKYFELLPEGSDLKVLYWEMKANEGLTQKNLQDVLRARMRKGAIDVNIMTKLDRSNYNSKKEQLPVEYNDAMAALRGFAESDLESSVVFSAGMNPRLYSYCERFRDFYPSNKMKKKIIIKVSDYRSALVQGKIFAKKGLWVSEFRIESGLNCGGHAFATDGLLMGPILDEFKQKRNELQSEMQSIYVNALKEKGEELFDYVPTVKIAVQGGVGTSDEHQFFLNYFNVDSVGWGSPFLLVPEATDVDAETLHLLENASPSDYYLSNSSPLGVPFNNLRNTSSDKQRKRRIEEGKPGSPCYLKFLALNTEFSDIPMCTASLKYQRLKIDQLNSSDLNDEEKSDQLVKIQEPDCLCSGLGVPALVTKGIKPMFKLSAVTICPGPNLAYFTGKFTLKEMIDHIYGRTSILNNVPRPHVFANELNLYLDYLKNEIKKCKNTYSIKQLAYFNLFRKNLFLSIDYYANLKMDFGIAFDDILDKVKLELNKIELNVATN